MGIKTPPKDPHVELIMSILVDAKRSGVIELLKKFGNSPDQVLSYMMDNEYERELKKEVIDNLTVQEEG